MSVTRTSRRLADGREIIYFDDTPRRAPTATAEDTRPLGDRARPASSATTPWSTTGSPSPATGRTAPSCRPRTSARCARPAPAACPPSPRAGLRRRGLREPLPVLRPGLRPRARRATADAAEPTRPAAGRCEVVCFTSDHDSSFADLSPERARTVIDAWADRTAELGALPEVEQVFCFENRGQRDRRDAAPPARPDLRLSLCAATLRGHPRAGDRAPRAHRPPPRRRHPRRRAGGQGAGRRSRASTGPPTSRSPPAGRSRCTWPRTATCPTCPPSTDAERDDWPASTSTCCGGSTATTSPRTAARCGCPTSPGGTRPRPRRGATSPACTCR